MTTVTFLSKHCMVKLDLTDTWKVKAELHYSAMRCSSTEKRTRCNLFTFAFEPTVFV